MNNCGGRLVCLCFGLVEYFLIRINTYENSFTRSKSLSSLSRSCYLFQPQFSNLKLGFGKQLLFSFFIFGEQRLIERKGFDVGIGRLIREEGCLCKGIRGNVEIELII